MRMRMFFSILCASFVTSFMTINVGAQANPEEVRLQEMQKDMDQQIDRSGKTSPVESLSKEFAYPPEGIEALRNGKRGWGEVTIQLSLAEKLAPSLAEQLHASDPAKYPTVDDAMTEAMAEAVAKVGALRDEGMGWGNVAKMLGFKLGPIVSSVQHVRHELDSKQSTERRKENTGKKSGAEKADLGKLKTDKPEHVERAKRVERVARPERPERPIRPERPERPQKPERLGH